MRSTLKPPGCSSRTFTRDPCGIAVAPFAPAPGQCSIALQICLLMNTVANAHQHLPHRSMHRCGLEKKAAHVMWPHLPARPCGIAGALSRITKSTVVFAFMCLQRGLQTMLLP